VKVKSTIFFGDFSPQKVLKGWTNVEMYGSGHLQGILDEREENILPTIVFPHGVPQAHG
jgi:hypothetical protein